MKIVHIIIILFNLVFLALSAGENLIRNGDFSLYPKSAGNEYRLISAWKYSRFDLFTEDSNWNKCGVLKILGYAPYGKNHKVATASVLIGVHGKETGFKCKPDTAYRYSVQVKGNVDRAFLRGVEWKNGDTLWKFTECKKSKQTVTVGQEWSTVKGTFKTGPTADRAALDIGIWWSSQYEKDPHVLKPGDYLLFDNVKVEEVRSVLSVETAETPAEIKTVKAAELILSRPGKAVSADDPSWEKVQPVSDFLLFSGKSRAQSNAEVSFQAQSDGTNIYILGKCQDPEGVTFNSPKGMWHNDVIELFFDDLSGTTGSIQVAVGACGGIYTGSSSQKTVPGVKAEVKVTGNSWRAFVSVPIKSIYPQGLPRKGSRLGFNVALKRTKTKEYYSWNQVKTLRSVSQYGVLVVGGYGEGITRTAYEKKYADAAMEAQKKKFAAFKESKTAIGLLSVTSDYSIPMSAGLIDPVNEIRIKAAVNEIYALPIAVANLDGKATEFRVTLEAGDKTVFNGSYGLKNYPAEKIITRVAVRTRDGAGCSGELFDPLPRINEASTVLIPAGECGVVWFDFHTDGIKPGIYSGVLRVTPLNKKGKFIRKKNAGYHKRNYQGTRLEIPVTLEVRDIVLDRNITVPSQFFANGVEENENLFAAGLELGAAGYSVSPWHLKFPLQKDGSFLPEAPAARERIESLRKLAGKYNIPFRFLIAYSVYDTFLKLYGFKDNSDQAVKLWPEWIKTLKKFMAASQVRPEQFVAELFDEPADFKKVVQVVTSAHEAWPELRNMLTLDSRQGKSGGNYELRMRVPVMRQMEAAVDTWVLHRNYYFSDPEHLKFYKEIQAKGKKVGHYTCETNPTSQLHGNYRLSAWFSECYNLDVTELYQLVQGIGYNGGVDFASVTDGNLLLVAGYKGKVIPTIRGMAVRQGIMDVKYLAKLRKIAGNSVEAKQFLETAARKVVKDQRFNTSMPDQVREEAARLILKLQEQYKK